MADSLQHSEASFIAGIPPTCPRNSDYPGSESPIRGLLRYAPQPSDRTKERYRPNIDSGTEYGGRSPEHIDKIVETYQFRKEEKRYSRRVTMEEIVENDYNLNISRYVSTAMPEPEIDLAATHGELKNTEKAIKAAATKHNKFLKELKLPTLP